MVFYPDMPPPADDYLALVHEVAPRLLEVAERLRQHWAAHAATLGLSAIAVKVLLHLSRDETVPMRRLAQQLDYDASNLTTVVDRLAQRGVLERSADEHDRRIKALRLTAEGERLRDRFWSSLMADPGPLAPLSESDLRRVDRLLSKLDTSAG
jgi:DNA-binding MarR family transcriptional regulator